MANYQTHKNIGIISSFSITILFVILLLLIDKELLNNKYIEIDNNTNFYTILLMIFFGYIGSIFPDIDLSTSKPIQLFKNILYGLSVIILIVFFDSLKQIFINLDFHFIKQIFDNNSLFFDLIFITIMLIIPYFFINIFFKIIHKTTHHRGIIHSIPFAFFISLLLYIALDSSFLKHITKDLNLNILFISIMFFIGNIVHFILDEIYSVDFRNKRIKKSFATALTFFSIKDFKKYLFIYLLIILTINFFIFNIISYNNITYYLKGIF